MRIILSLALLLGFSPTLWAQVGGKRIEYKQGTTSLEGWFFLPEGAGSSRRPGVLLAHEAGAASSLARAKCQALAQQGYGVFSVDLYGKGYQPQSLKDAQEKLGMNSGSRALLRDRMEAGRQSLEKISQVDPSRIGAVGYGIGGTGVLELARSRTDLKSVICIHGDLASSGTQDQPIGPSVLAIIGSEDPLAKPASLAAFQSEMTRAEGDWQLVVLGGVAGDFTNPGAGKDLKSGKAFDADADKRTSGLTRLFLTETLSLAKSDPGAVPVSQRSPGSGQTKPTPPTKPVTPPKGIPEKVLKVLDYIDKNDEAMKGYEGGRNFGNFERRLPQSEPGGKRIRYREWDVNPLRPGVNRGAERLVTGSDGSAYYTDDHYSTFKKIR